MKPRKKILMVHWGCQGEYTVPTIKVSGQWLVDYNSSVGDYVILEAHKGKITIKKVKEKYRWEAQCKNS